MMNSDQIRMLKDTLVNCSDKRALVMEVPGTMQTGCRFAWWNKLLQEMDVDGEILVMFFDVLDTAASGKYRISFSYQPGTIFDADWNDLTFDITDGSVMIL